MTDILQGLKEAFWLIVLLDADLVDIVVRSLYVTLSAVIIGSAIGIPL